MNKIIRAVAVRHSVSPERVEHDMLGAMREAMKNGSPEARSFWERLSPLGEEPSLENFIKAVSDIAINSMNSSPAEAAK